MFVHVSGTELRTEGRTIQTLDAPGGPFRPWASKTRHLFVKHGCPPAVTKSNYGKNL